MNTHVRQIAIIGSTASGKTSLAIKAAKHLNAHILSLDSLSVYKEIDIVSAKPSMEERDDIRHFGMDVLYPDENFDVTTFISLYQDIYQRCREEKKALVIVGGTSFYLKMLLEGVSVLPSISDEIQNEASCFLADLPKAYDLLQKKDPEYMCSIERTDRYRIEKALHIYLQTSLPPSLYFKQHPPVPTIRSALPIYQIEWKRELLRERIVLRTKHMVKEGLIDEICRLEAKYTRAPNCMKAIGIKETLAYLDGIYTKDEMVEKIMTNTARLAKRQRTFNHSQFNAVIKGSAEALEKVLL